MSKTDVRNKIDFKKVIDVSNVEQKVDLLLHWYQNFCDWVEILDKKVYNQSCEYADMCEAENELPEEDLFEDGELDLDEAEAKLERLFKNDEISEICYNNYKARF